MHKNIILKRNMTLGDISAEHDDEFLDECFVCTPEFEELCDFSNRKMILLGRTGSGKTALLNQIKNKVDFYIQIKPDIFAFQYISSVPFVKSLIEKDVNLDIFYKFLWLHEITSQIIKNYFTYNKKDYISELRKYVTNIGRINQLKKYVEEYEGVFFDEGISEKITKEMENSIAAVIGDQFANIKGNITDSQKQEIQIKASQYINKKQISQLKNIITLFKEYFSNNKQKKLIVAIDNLDEKWVEGESKYKLIDALLSAIKEFSDIKNLKILIAMRADLLAKTCQITKRQNEKDNSFTIKLDWDARMLKDMLDKRIKYLFSHKYMKNTGITFADIFTTNIKSISAIDYIVERSMMRPRDIINFVNLCIIEADGENEISENNVLKAEEKYKVERLQALEHEWSNVYGNIELYINILYKLGNCFYYKDLIQDKYRDIETMVYEGTKNPECSLAESFFGTADSDFAKECNIRELLNCMYAIGLIGIKKETGVKYATPTAPTLTVLDYNDNIQFCIYPLFKK